MRNSEPLRPLSGPGLPRLLRAVAAVLVTVSSALAQGIPAREPVLGPVFQLPAPASANAYQGTAALASNGTVFLAVWTESEAESRVLAARVRASDGEVLDSEPMVLGVFRSFQCLPAVASAGGGFLVVWEDHGESTGSDIVGARVEPAADGGYAVAPLILSDAPGEQTAPTVAASSGGYLVAWEDYSGTFYDIHAARVGAGSGGAVQPAFVVETGAFHKFRPVAASAGGDFLVAWEDLRHGEADVYGRRVRGVDGALLDAGALPLAAHPGDQINLALASNGEVYLLAWEDYRVRGSADVYAARVRASDGALLDPLGITVGPALNNQVMPAAASSGGDFLVVWEDYRLGLGETDVRGTRVSGADGSLLESDLVLEGSPGAQYAPALAAVEGRYLAAWQCAGATGYEFRIRARTADFDEDADRDGHPNRSDNCRVAANPDQADLDGDGEGDACDADDDADAVPDVADNCPVLANPGQGDADRDGLGDACDPSIVVTIDVVPWSRANHVRVDCGHWVVVVVLGARGFDASQVDPPTVRFAGAAPMRFWSLGYTMGLYDVNQDGHRDLWLMVLGEETDLSPGDTEARLEGRLRDGTHFTGTDRVWVTR